VSKKNRSRRGAPAGAASAGAASAAGAAGQAPSRRGLADELAGLL